MGNTSLQGHRLEHSGSNTFFPKYYPGGSLDMQCLRQESCSRVFTLAFTFKAPGLFVRWYTTLVSSPLVHSEVLAPVQSRIHSLSVFEGPEF